VDVDWWQDGQADTRPPTLPTRADADSGAARGSPRGEQQAARRNSYPAKTATEAVGHVRNAP